MLNRCQFVPVTESEGKELSLRHHFVSWVQQGLTSHQTQDIGHIGTCFYGSNDPTNSVKALKEDTRLN